MRNTLAHLIDTIDDWVPEGGNGRKETFWALNLIDKKHLCDFDKERDIKEIINKLKPLSHAHKTRLNTLNAEHTITLLKLPTDKVIDVIDEQTDKDPKQLREFCIVLHGMYKKYPEARSHWVAACRTYFAIKEKGMFFNYEPAERDQYLSWLGNLKLSERQQLTGITSTSDCMYLNQYHAWELYIELGADRCIAILGKGQTDYKFDKLDKATIFHMSRSYSTLSEMQATQFALLEPAHQAEILKLPTEIRDALLEMDIDPLLDLCQQLTKLTIQPADIEEAKAEDTTNGWWMLQSFGYAETLRRLAMAEQLDKVNKVVTAASKLYGSYYFRSPTGLSAVHRDCTALELPKQYPFAASTEALGALHTTIHTARDIIIAEGTNGLARTRLEEKSDTAALPPTAPSMTGWLPSIPRIPNPLSYMMTRDKATEEWYRLAQRHFSEIDNPPSPPGSASPGADGLFTTDEAEATADHPPTTFTAKM